MNYKDAKVVQALDYLVTSLKGGCSKLNLLKLVYLADRYHLRKFGRTVTGDSYRAMPYGSFPGTTTSWTSRTCFRNGSGTRPRSWLAIGRRWTSTTSFSRVLKASTATSPMNSCA